MTIKRNFKKLNGKKGEMKTNWLNAGGKGRRLNYKMKVGRIYSNENLISSIEERQEKQSRQ